MLIKWPFNPSPGRHWFFRYIGGPAFIALTAVGITAVVLGMAYTAYHFYLNPSAAVTLAIGGSVIFATLWVIHAIAARVNH